MIYRVVSVVVTLTWLEQCPEAKTSKLWKLLNWKQVRSLFSATVWNVKILEDINRGKKAIVKFFLFNLCKCLINVYLCKFIAKISSIDWKRVKPRLPQTIRFVNYWCQSKLPQTQEHFLSASFFERRQCKRSLDMKTDSYWNWADSFY